MQLAITPQGKVNHLYTEELFALEGEKTIRRASHVEPDSEGRWWADMSPVQGPNLGPFRLRSEALAVEVAWLEERLSSL